jgi:serine/threonine protein kinase
VLKYYDFLEEIGSGQYGVVHLGKHKKGNQKVAIKASKKKNMDAE